MGDDVFSIGFDGLNFWVGGHSLAPPTTRRLVRQSESVAGDTTPKSETTPTVSEGDVIGCCLDLERGVVWYMRNGERVTGELGIGHCRDMLTPAVSFSAGIRCVCVCVCVGVGVGVSGWGVWVSFCLSCTTEVTLPPQCYGISWWSLW